VKGSALTAYKVMFKTNFTDQCGISNIEEHVFKNSSVLVAIFYRFHYCFNILFFPKNLEKGQGLLSVIASVYGSSFS
jgi:hypothetical protein